jgi:hypothetical protein
MEYSDPKRSLNTAVNWLRKQLGLPHDGLSDEQRAEAERLAALSPFQYEKERKAAAKKLEVRTSVLDATVEGLRACGEEKELQGTELTIDPPVPWTESVEGQTLVDELKSAIKEHVILSDAQAIAIALWVIHTHAWEAAQHFPRLHIDSPTKRCGKTTLLDTIALFVSKPLRTEDISDSALFRTMEKAKPTLLMDEADKTMWENNDDRRRLLNAGHGLRGAVIRTVGDDFEPRAFRVAGPVALAGIGELPGTLEDRSIGINLRRKLRSEKVSRLDLRENRTEHLTVLGRKAARWVADHIVQLMAADPTLPEELNDRQWDNWRPLIAIADTISPSFGEKARAVAKEITLEKLPEEPDKSSLALADVAEFCQLFPNKKVQSSEDIVAHLNAMPDRPWRTWRKGENMTRHSLARLLRPFRLSPQNHRFSHEVLKGYLVEKILKEHASILEAEQEIKHEEPATHDEIPF